MHQPLSASLGDLPEALHGPVQAYMASYIDMFETGIASGDNLSHSGPDRHPKASETNREWLQSLMDDGLRVSAWRAQPWKQPRWSVFKMYRLQPKPTVYVHIDLHCESSGRRQEAFAALAPAIDGSLRQCYYVLK